MRLLALDITPDELRIARAERLLGTTRLTEVRRLRPDELTSLARPHPARVLATLPAASVTHRILTLPFRDRRRLARTVPLDLRGRLPADGEDTIVAFDRLATAIDGATVLAAAARRADVEELSGLIERATLLKPRLYLSPLPAWNLVPASLTDAALLVADGERSTLSIRRGGRVTGLRSLNAVTASEVSWTLAALGPAPPVLLVAGGDASPDLITALAAASGIRTIPLTDVAPQLHGPDALACAVAAGLALGGAAPIIAFAGEEDETSLRRIAALAALALVLGGVDLALVRHGLARRDARLVAAIHAEAAAVLPEARLLAPRAELEAAVAAAEQRGGSPGGSVLRLLRELSLRKAPAVRVDFDDVSVEPDVVRLHGRAESFEAVDTLRTTLAASPLLRDVTADETRPTVDGHGVEFRLRARRSDGRAAS